MKLKILSIFLCFLSLVGNTLKAQTVNFPDENFLEYLLLYTDVDSNKDGEIQVTEAEAYNGNFTINNSISDLTGIENFKNLSGLGIFAAQVTKLDISKNEQLQRLVVKSSPLVTIDVSNNKKLIQAEIQNNNFLKNFLLGDNSQLQYLNLMYNAITSINLSKTVRVTNLYLGANQLTSIDVSNLPRLAELNLGGNKVSELNLSNNKRLTYLHLGLNKLSQLDVSNNPLIDILFVQGNPISKLDLSNNKSITQLIIDQTNITEIDLAPLEFLQFFYANFSQLKEIDASKNENLIYINATSNEKLEFINYKNGKNINTFGFFSINSPKLKCVQVDDPNYSSTQELWQKDETSTYSTDCASLLATKEIDSKKIEVFPNPTRGELNFTNKMDKIEVYNSLGQLVKSFSKVKSINIYELPQGLYIIKAYETSSQKAQTTKIIKN